MSIDEPQHNYSAGFQVQKFTPPPPLFPEDAHQGSSMDKPRVCQTKQHTGTHAKNTYNWIDYYSSLFSESISDAPHHGPARVMAEERRRPASGHCLNISCHDRTGGMGAVCPLHLCLLD